MTHPPRLALTMGDPAGVGPEIIVKACRQVQPRLEAGELRLLVIGHRSDRLHPFGDANRLANQLPNARLVEARSMWELRVSPARMTTEIADFLSEVWTTEARGRRPA